MTDEPKRRRRKPLISREDAELWARLTSRVKPLAETPPVVVPEAEEPLPEPDPAAPPQLPGPRLPRPEPGAAKRERKAPALTHGSTAGVDKRTAERFKKGDMEIEARIDLHGLTREAAHIALTRFIQGSAAARRRMVLVITGKGRQSGEGEGILRAEVPRWLNEPALRPLVLSFSYAQPRHGGEGALYVFLKRERTA
ncbi:Smr/MutS family protein [Oleispirillum naphthae]|uniref:Smr/MutS family protein n=1 Tax=Oleispirillum naphthae TaxID=2838853 RepID=UPI0030825E4B